MTMTLNGSGTITGLSAGGLPDATIQPADLSTGGPYWDTSGNVGIGTSSPSAKLNVYDGTSSSILASTPASDVQIAASSSGYGIVGTVANYALVMRTNATERARIDTSGNLLVGTTTAYAKVAINSGSLGAQALSIGEGTLDAGVFGIVQVTRPATNDTKFCYAMVRNGNAIAGIGFAQNSNTMVIANGGSGTAGNGMTLATNASSWGSQSDERKKNILGYIEDAVNKILTLRTVFFEYKSDEDKQRRVGFIAQDVQAVLPEAVHVDDDEDNTLNVQYSDVIPLLTAAIQEQQALITQLQADVAQLKGQA